MASNLQKKIYYSCVVDDDPKFYWQGYIFILCLLQLAKVEGKNIFVHLTSKNNYFEKFLSDNDVHSKYIEPWGDKKYCNKLQQLETKELQEADYVFFCDTDIAITESMRYLALKNIDFVLGKTVDFENPPLDKLQAVYDFFRVPYPQISKDTLTGTPTFIGNFNGGFYGIPSKHIKKIVKQWKHFAQLMLVKKEIVAILNEKINHIDQISFSLTISSLMLNYKLLAYRYNCPTHVSKKLLKKKIFFRKAKIIHYHDNINSLGLLNRINFPLVDTTIDKINNVIKDNFDDVLFRNYRYRNKL